MKIYNKFRKLKTSTKIGLVSSVVYAAGAFAIPAFANVERPGQSVEHTVEHPVEKPVVFQPVDVTTITTSEQAETVYQEKVVDYSSDKVLKHDELESLFNIKKKKLGILTEGKSLANEQYEEAKKTEAKRLDIKIANYNKKLGNISKPPEFSKIEKQIKKTILVCYPGILNKEDGNLVYSGEIVLEPHLIKPFKDIVSKVNQILEENYQDTCLEFLTAKENYDLSNVLMVYNLLDEERAETPELIHKKEELQKKINSLISRKENIESSENLAPFRGRVESLDSKMAESLKFVTWFDQYSSLKEEFESFKSQQGDLSEYFSVSYLKIRKLRKSNFIEKDQFKLFKKLGKDFDTKQKSIVSGLESLIQSKGMRIGDFNNTVKTKFNLTWFLWLGFIIPIVRNLTIKSYVEGSKGSAYEYAISGYAGVISGAMGLILIDGLHPWVYPARMLTPFLFQPLLSIAKKKGILKIDKK